MSLADRVEGLRARIARACEAGNRDPESIELLPVSKKQPLALIQEAAALGFARFGENYVQEGADKAAAFPDLAFVLLGPLQRNKAKPALQHFAEIQSLDRPDLAERLRRLASNVFDVPDGKAFVARQHGGDAIALDVFQRCDELPFDLIHAEQLRNVVAAEHAGALRLLYQTLDHLSHVLANCFQLQCFQRDGGPAFGVGSLVDVSNRRVAYLTENLEAADLIRHFLLPQKGHKARCLQTV